LASFLIDADRNADALAAIDRALVGAAGDAGLWLERGRACLLLDRCAEAVAALQRARELGVASETRCDLERLGRLATVPGLFAAMRRVDQLLLREDRAAALRAARVFVRRDRRIAEAWLFLGIVCHKLGRERRAEWALRRALQLDGELAEAHNRLGILLVVRGELRAGYQHLVRAEALAPVDPSPQLHLAQACVLLGRRDDGSRHLDQAARFGANPEMVAAIRRQFFAKGA
jgi:Flp pilus assembly protein TadD